MAPSLTSSGCLAPGTFRYTDIRFADIQMLRYRLDGFKSLPAEVKAYIYCLSQATLYGRDITFDQFGKYNLLIRKTLEAVHAENASPSDADADEIAALTEYLRRVWFSNGIYHHYGCEKFVPAFSEQFFRRMVKAVEPSSLPLHEGENVDDLLDRICPVMFNPEVMPKRVNKTDGQDLVATSACNYYEGVTQAETEEYYAALKAKDGHLSHGLNTKLTKGSDGRLVEFTYKVGELYSEAITHIIHWLSEASRYAENEAQRHVITLLIEYYTTGDLATFDEYSIAWVKAFEGKVDFINGFIEVYGDPIGLKGSWEGIVEYVDEEATTRTRKISDNAQWFEDHSPIDPRFRKKEVKGVTAKVICAAMLGGDEYPSTAIGINLPNADWIRAEHGSKSITISNITHAYNEAAKGSGTKEEFVIDASTRELITRYGDITDNLHTDLHECLGHGSGRLLDGVDPDALKAYGNTIEEARADLFALYYLADDKLVELELLPDAEAYKAEYYSYIMNGLLTQLVRISPGSDIEEAHMRNRALISRYALENSGGNVCLKVINGKTYVAIDDYKALRGVFAQLLAEVQRIKSCGDYVAARELVERYGVKIDGELHKEVLERYAKLNIAPYKGFINPVLTPIYDNGVITDVKVDYSESYDAQMLRYGRDYGTIIP